MKYTIIAIVVSLAIGFGLGSQLMPKIKAQITETEKGEVKKDIVTVVKETIRPDGTKEVVTTTTDRSKESNSTTSKSKVAASTYHASIQASPNNISLSDVRYTVSLERRVLGDIFLGGNISRDNLETRVGITIGMDF